VPIIGFRAGRRPGGSLRGRDGRRRGELRHQHAARFHRSRAVAPHDCPGKPRPPAPRDGRAGPRPAVAEILASAVAPPYIFNLGHGIVPQTPA